MAGELPWDYDNEVSKQYELSEMHPFGAKGVQKEEISIRGSVSLFDKEFEEIRQKRECVTDSGTSRDLNAMSVASLYEGHGDVEIKITKTYKTDKPTIAEKCKSPYDENTVNSTLLFADQERSIDFVLAWKREEAEDLNKSHAAKRDIFEQNLINEGLELERESFDDNLHIIKVHAPVEVLRRYAEILKLRMPMKEIPGMDGLRSTTSSIYGQLKGMAKHLGKKLVVDEHKFPPKSQRFTAVYSRDKEYLFDIEQSCFFTAAIRSRIVQFILDRKRFTANSDNYDFGVDRLITYGTYVAAYPLHDGEIRDANTMRCLLYHEWAAVRKWYRYQPLDYIKEYFGVKIGLYFAWLGYYTYMLLLAAVVGFACFIYSWSTRNSYVPGIESCSSNLTITMCPLCDYCQYWDLKQTCLHTKAIYLIDNPTTVFFSIFMSFWAALFLELWKRYSAEITHRWDLTGFDMHEEHPRPEYLARLGHVKRVKIDYVTKTKEPYPPYWRMKLPATLFSFSVVMLLVALAIAAVLAVVLYRLAVITAWYGKDIDTSSAIILTTATASTINLVLIVIFNYAYTWVAEYLTEFEVLRTQTEFDDSLTLKIYLLQFVNYYSSTFYIAFFKGKFVGYPGHYIRFFDFRQEECGLGGCLMELCIQLAIIMIGKQFMNTVLEMLWPKFMKWWNTSNVKLWKRKSAKSDDKDARWLNDLKLVEWGCRGLFPEYLEMILQYGFVTIFVAAFPLAPLCALINNVLEMRLDARKLLTFYRRPVSQRVRDIGVWYRILDCIGKLSVITNAFIIAFTSDFIPRLIYRASYSQDGTLNGYLNHSLAYFDVRHFTQKNKPPMSVEYQNISYCRYPDYREPPWSANKYERTSLYWITLAARLGFVVLFENIVALVMIIVRWVIPDQSQKLKDQIRREAYITKEIIIKQETLRARSEQLIKHRFKKDGNVSMTPPISEDPTQCIQNNQIMSSKLSGSQLDLLMYGEGEFSSHTPTEKAPQEESV